MGFWNDGLKSPSPTRSRRRTSSHDERQSQYSSRPSTTPRGSSFFTNPIGSSRGYGSSSRARPRSGFINKIRKFIRDIYYYMRKHPLKVFMLVIMPLLTGGALSKILGTFGVRLPGGLSNLMGGGGSRNFARGGARDFGGGTALPGMGGGIGESIGGLMNVAKMFM